MKALKLLHLLKQADTIKEIEHSEQINQDLPNKPIEAQEDIEYILEKKYSNILTGGNFGNAHFAEKYQGFDLARGRYEINPITGERRYY